MTAQLPARASVVIVGTGFSGLGMAIALRKAGMDDFIIVEKADEVGGTWRENTYPGCACDIRSYLYSFSFEPKSDWSREFAPWQEILEYLKHCADKYDLRRHIHFGTEVTGLEFDDDSATWRVMTVDGQEVTARAVMAATGPLHVPKFPEIPGLERFEGTAFHSAEWDHSAELSGKRIAVIGTGSSAIQFIPQIARNAGHLTVFQRTPPWIIPKPDRKITEREHRLYGAVPALGKAYRGLIYWQQEALGIGFTHPKLNKLGERVAKWHMRSQIRDRSLIPELTPDYTLGCKRVIVSSDYYPTLNRPNVDLVTDGIAEVRENSIVTADGREVEADVIIFGTGFHVTDKMDDAHIVGRGGLKIQDAWRDGVEAYLGTTIAGFPHLYMFMGPNTGLGHNSMIFMLEAQIRHVMKCLRMISNERARFVDVKPRAQQRFNEWVQERSSHAVWVAGGCKSWYLDEAGVNRAAWPASSLAYWFRMRRLRTTDYDIIR